MGDTYSFSINTQTLAANRNHLDLFNASGSGKIIRITSIQLWSRPTAAIVGINIVIEGIRTTSVGTGGTVLTADKEDTDQPNLPAQITARQQPAGGAALSGNALFAGNVYTEEAANMMPMLPIYNNEGDTKRRQFIIREGQGIVLRQGPYGTVGIIGMKIEFEVV